MKSILSHELKVLYQDAVENQDKIFDSKVFENDFEALISMIPNDNDDMQSRDVIEKTICTLTEDYLEAGFFMGFKVAVRLLRNCN